MYPQSSLSGRASLSIGELPADIPPRAAQALCDAVDLLNPALADADQFLDLLISDVESPVLGALASLHSTLDEFMGGVDYSLSQAYEQWRKIETKLISDVAKPLAGGREALIVAGFTPPYHWTDMAAAVEGDPIDLVSAAVPAIGVSMGYTPPDRTGPTPPGTMPPITDPAAALAQVETDPAALYTAGGTEWNLSTATVGRPPVLTPPPVPPYAPTVPGVPPQAVPLPAQPAAVAPAGAPAVCCPAPVNVTVHVPPAAGGAQVVPTEPQIYPGNRPPDELVMDGYVKYRPDLGKWVYTTEYHTNTTNVVNVNNVIPAAAPAPGAAPPLPQQPPLAPLKLPIPADRNVAAYPLAINWGDLNTCKLAAAENSQVKPAGAPAPLVSIDTDQPWQAYVDNLYGKGIYQRVFGAGAKPLDDKIMGALKAIGEAGGPVVNATKSFVDNSVTPVVLQALSASQLVNYQAALFYGTKLATAQKLESNTSFPAMYLMQGETYSFQYANPQYLPNQVRTDGAYLAGEISDAVWECWTRANGNHPEPARRAMLADQLRPGVRELIDLHRRGHITEPDLWARMREQGILDRNYVKEYLAVTTELPTMSDLVRFMVRDAADEKVVKDFGYDEGFDQKYTDQMQKWGEALGLDPLYMRYAWRSHWEIPSYTQLVEMLARLRPDRLEVREWDKEWGGGVPGVTDAAAPPRPATVTAADVKQALQINDMSPKWVEKLMAVSYTPINRTDATRAYMNGAYDDEQMYDALLNTRYSPRDAKQVLETLKKDKERRIRNVTGSWSARKTLSAYKNKLINRSEAETLLEGLIPDRKIVRKTLDEAELDMTVAERNQRLKALKRGFVLGEFAQADLLSILVSFGLDRQQAERTITMWTIERDGRYRMPTVAQISKWVKAAIISVEEARHRLGNMGFKAVDADRIIAAALQFDYDGEPPSQEELSQGIEEAIKNQKAARKKSTGGLMNRMSQIIRELNRVRGELNRRADDAGTDKLEPLVIP